MIARLFKTIAQLLGRLRAAPHVARYILAIVVLGRQRAFSGASERLAKIPGQWGVYTRQAFYRWTLDHLGRDVYFGFMSLLSKPDIRIGDSVYIGRFCTIGLADLGDAVMLADNVSILSGRHQHGRSAVGADAGQTLQDNEQTYTRVMIASGAWIGASAVVMANVGRGAIVGAGAVVVKPVEANSTVAGVPAKTLNASPPTTRAA